MKLSSLKKFKKGLIIHHWDTDGLCSAALLLKHFQKLNQEIDLKYRPPIINNYFLTDLELVQIKKENFDFIIAVDINFPPKTIQQLQEITENFYWFDHHHQIEPVKAEGKQDAEYLSCAHLVSDYLASPDSLLAVYGMVGDKEEKVKTDPLVVEVQKKYNLRFTDLMQAKTLIDSNYILDSYRGMEETVQILQHTPLEVLENKKLQENVFKIQEEQARVTQSKPEINKEIFTYTLESPYNILSAVSRILAKNNPNKIIINSQSKGGQSNLYVRTAREDIDLRKLLAAVKKKGYQSGGKKEVLGVMLGTNKLENFKKEIATWIIKNYLS